MKKPPTEFTGLGGLSCFYRMCSIKPNRDYLLPHLVLYHSIVLVAREFIHIFTYLALESNFVV